jgi:predicted Zn-dependent protease
MDSRTLQLLADEAQQEVDEASRREREAELQLRLARADHAAKRKTLRLLQKETCEARTVRNILIPRVFGSVYVCMSGISVNNS